MAGFGPAKPDVTAMGDNDIKNILFVNLYPKGLKSHPDLLKKKDKLELYTDWLSLKAGMETFKQISQRNLPSDTSVVSQMKRSSYRSKVVDYNMRSSYWIEGSETKREQREFSTKRADFHAALLTNFLEGFNISSSVHTALEGILKTIGDSIVQTKEINDRCMFYVFMTVYTWDKIRESVRPLVRTYYFEATREMKSAIVDKVTKDRVEMKMSYVQNDALFEVGALDERTEQAIKEQLTTMDTKIINKPVDVLYDP